MAGRSERVGFKNIKSVNIRNYTNKSVHRQHMGYFKHEAYKAGLFQEEMLTKIMNHCYKTGLFEKKPDIDNNQLSFSNEEMFGSTNE